MFEIETLQSMNTSPHIYPLVKLPPSTQTILYLISQELKIRRFFNALHKAGIDDVYFEPHLDKLILAQMEMDDGSDEIMEWFNRIIDKRSRKIEPNSESVMKQAMKVYTELVWEKRKRKTA
jgi:hypothetical protein